MDIIITGQPGVGKTTVCERLILILKKNGLRCGGVLSPWVPEGFDIVDIQTGEARPFARLGKGEVTVGSFVFDRKGVDFALGALENSRDCDVIFIDEIGSLELRGGGLMPAVKLLAASDTPLIIISRSWLSNQVKELLSKRTFLTFEATEANREDLPPEISRVFP
ncbi:MAG: AAA family ATPase [Candidatus Altiarchaeota archaeon]|nr:AAA family ATPase [Candidatus Altiarchaeota archaeon]